MAMTTQRANRIRPVSELDRHARTGTARVADVLSIGVAGLMAAAAAAGLLAPSLYPDGTWAREAFRGGDLVTLTIGVPALVASLVSARKGSCRARVVWIGTLAYGAYNYAFYVFGARFNDLFLLHIAIFSGSVFALAFALPNLDAAGIAESLRRKHAPRWVGGCLVVVGAVQGLLWIALVIRNAFTRAVLRQVPVAGQHLVFALDLAFLTPTLVMAGVLLWRRASWGYVLAGGMSVMGLLYQLNATAAGMFQLHAGVSGAKALPPEGLLLTAGFAAAVVALLVPRFDEVGGRESADH